MIGGLAGRWTYVELNAPIFGLGFVLSLAAALILGMAAASLLRAR
jgi:hypothetical protein